MRPGALWARLLAPARLRPAHRPPLWSTGQRRATARPAAPVHAAAVFHRAADDRVSRRVCALRPVGPDGHPGHVVVATRGTLLALRR
ncbi:hypothetical protein [Actinacidiphila glaucinigra]|uniref:hypothetical protein n=1 Tax=Actinacidiphila glaucinigra TaxID=235986 RepID=UPI00366AA97D